MDSFGTARHSRCLVVWAATTLGVALLLVWLSPDLPTTPADLASPFDRVVIHGAALVLALCACWWWSVTTAVVLDTLRAGHRTQVPGVPGAVRRLVLAACGVALVSTAQPALATPGAVHEHTHAGARGVVVDGLPLPVRPLGAVRTRRVHAPPQVSAPPEVVVADGDSLWSLAAARLGPGAVDADVTTYWHRIHALNRTSIGPDPDLLHPGQRLLLPLPRPHRPHR